MRLGWNRPATVVPLDPEQALDTWQRLGITFDLFTTTHGESRRSRGWLVACAMLVGVYKINASDATPKPYLTVYILYVRTRVRTHARARGRSRTVLANEHKRKRTRTQINSRKFIVAFDAWAISACKRDCVLRVRSKTFRMYFRWIQLKPFTYCVGVSHTSCMQTIGLCWQKRPVKSTEQYKMRQYFARLCEERKARYKEKLEIIGRSLDDKHYATDDQYVSDTICWPCVEYGHIFGYFIKRPGVYMQEQLLSWKQLDAYNYFQSGHVRTVYCRKFDRESQKKCVLKALVNPSQKSPNNAHHTWIAAKHDDEVISGHCTCMAG